MRTNELGEVITGVFFLEGDRWRKEGSRNGGRDGKGSIGLTTAHGSHVFRQAGGAGRGLSPAGTGHADGADGANGYHHVGALVLCIHPPLPTLLSCPSIHLTLVLVAQGSQTGPAVLSRAGELSPLLWGRAQTFPSLSSLCSSVWSMKLGPQVVL